MGASSPSLHGSETCSMFSLSEHKSERQTKRQMPMSFSWF